jgi:hypothetical protein
MGSLQADASLAGPADDTSGELDTMEPDMPEVGQERAVKVCMV